MTRKLLFQIHWLLGITAGLVLAVMGVTGAILSFQDEWLSTFNPDVVNVAVPSPTSSRLSPSAIMRAASAAHGGQRVVAIVLAGTPNRAALVEFAPSHPRQHHGDRSYINPYTGQWLGLPRGNQFFLSVRDLHRYLLLPGAAGGIGRPITGIATFALIFFALSGLYLRWPRQPLAWRSWFSLDFRRRGRDLYRQLHAVIGTWLVLFYLLSALTGLWWSFEFYRNGLTHWLSSQPNALSARQAPTSPRLAAPLAATPPAQLDHIWQDYLQAVAGDFAEASVMLPRDGHGPVLIRSLANHARYRRMTDDWRYALNDGHRLGITRYQDLAAGDLFLAHILSFHDGSFFGLPGRLGLLLSSLTMPLFTVTGLLLYIGRRRQKQRVRAVALPVRRGGAKPAGPRIIYASQAGHAERLARLTAQAFAAEGADPELLILNHWQPSQAEAGRLHLFIVSTYGDGEPPDQGRWFAKSPWMMSAGPVPLGFEYALLALGDRLYPDFCGFGRQLDGWLQRAGARPVFPLLALDGESTQGVLQWQQQLRHWLQADLEGRRWAPQAWQSWRLLERRCLNPDATAQLAFALRLVPDGASLPEWQPGDLVEILPAATTAVADTSQRPREYSIASITAQAEIQLIVRQVVHLDGSLGVCSGGLTERLAIGAGLSLRIRSNPSFHPPALTTPLILIGSGTGLAGLLAHLRARAAAGQGDNWLIFGERQAQTDDFFVDELQQYLEAGHLRRLDRVYSREGHAQRYVQDQLSHAAAELYAWLQRGAAIYVCGSLHGMANDVDQRLRILLGAAELDALQLSGRYRRDVY